MYRISDKDMDLIQQLLRPGKDTSHNQPTADRVHKQVALLESAYLLADDLAAQRKELVAKHALGTVWLRSSGEHVPIYSMDDGHLVHALRVCIRADPRYTFFRARWECSLNMWREAQDRGIDHRHWCYGNYAENYGDDR